MNKPRDIRAGFEFKKRDGDWLMSLTFDNKLIVTFTSSESGLSETRTYDLEEITEYQQVRDFVILDMDERFYQFKFENGGFLVGDIYSEEGEFESEFAHYVFLEEE